MDNLYISNDFFNKIQSKQIFLSLLKTIYVNPYDKTELIVKNNDDVLGPYIEARVDAILKKDLSDHELDFACFPKKKIFTENHEFKGYVVNYVKDASNFNHLIETNMPLEFKLHLLKKADAILRLIHKQDIVICDLNPSNILFDRNGKVYLIDLLEGQIDYLDNEAIDESLTRLYLRCMHQIKPDISLDNVNMHLNLLRMLLPEGRFDDVIGKDIDDYTRIINKMKIPGEVKETFVRMKHYKEMSTIPRVTETIRQIL